jgi:dienelactone hydrolase
MKRFTVRLAVLGVVMSTVALVSASGQDVRTTDSPWVFPRVTSRAEWESRAARMRRTILFRAGLWPAPPRTPLNPQVFGRIERTGFTVEKAYFESLPGFFVTGNLYRPAPAAGDAARRPPYPAVLAPHGHAAYGRLEASDIFNEPARAANLARQGYVVFTYDMVGYNDSVQVPHQYAAPEAALWSFSVLGLQLWNAIRALDFLESLPDVDTSRIGASGASGGGTQTFLLAAVDERVKVSVPATMVSHYMQGGDNCENAAGLRLDHSNVEFAAMAAPRPMLLVSATGDWTRDTPRVEFPAIRDIYRLFGAEDRLAHVQFHAPHNFNRDGREASYAFFAQWLMNVALQPREPGGGVESPADLLVWFGRQRPNGADAASLLDYWRNLPTDPAALESAVAPDPSAAPPPTTEHRPAGLPVGAVLVTGSDAPELIAALTRSGRAVYFLTPFQETRDTTSRFFTTYNRTADQIRVQQVLAAGADLRKRYRVVDLVGTGPGGLTALAAFASSARASSATPTFRRVVADAGRFDVADERAYLDRLFIPGFLRAGGFGALPDRGVLVHNTGGAFRSPGDLREAPMAPAAIVEWLGRRD